MIHARSISNLPTSLCAPQRRRALIHATDEPTTEELEAGAAQSANDDAGEDSLAIPSSTIAPVDPSSGSPH